MENGIIIDGHIYELVYDRDIDRCSYCALLDQCCNFRIIVEDDRPDRLCKFLYGDEANNKRFEEKPAQSLKATTVHS